jgi:hypothetical protein
VRHLGLTLLSALAACDEEDGEPPAPASGPACDRYPDI